MKVGLHRLTILVRLGALPAAVVLGLCTWVLPLAGSARVPGAESSERTALAVEALLKLENPDLEKNEALKAAVFRVLEATRGTADFVRLVRKFRLSGQENGLLEVGVAMPTHEAGVDAMRLLLEGPGTNALSALLRGTNVSACQKVIQALGSSTDPRAVPWISPWVTGAEAEPALRREALKALARTRQGARVILEAAAREAWSDEWRIQAGFELAGVRWPEVREEAARILPTPKSADAEPLPALSELLARRGDVERGARIFAGAGPNCTSCHRVRGQGGDVGPDLSEIGTKLGKDALYEAILNPSAGISFGYEAWSLELTSGDEAFGLIVSETPEELSLKDTRGVVTRLPKAQIRQRTQMQLSVMPAGLQQTMSVQQLVDLVEFLASLRKS